MKRRRTLLVIILLVLPHLGAVRRPMRPPSYEDWPQFNTQPCDCPSPGPSGTVTAQNVGKLEPAWRIELPEPVDGSPLYVADIFLRGKIRNVLIVATMQGRTMAIDAETGEELWRTTPPPGPRWTTSSPALDPATRSYVYSYGLDGYIHRYDIRSGNELRGGGFPAQITKKGHVEKGSSAISVAETRSGKTYLYMTVAAYPEPGDDGDYQGRLVTIDLETGAKNIFNACCSDKPILFEEYGDDETGCPNRQSGIWARSGAVYDPVTDRVFVTTGNGVFDAHEGGYNWGSCIVALRPDGSTDGGTPLDTWTPTNYQQLNDFDFDLSSTTVAPLPERRPRAGMRPAVQSGKDGMVRLVNLADLSGRGGPRHIGGELQLLQLPQRGAVFTRPATWLAPDGTPWVFITNHLGTSAFTLTYVDGRPQLVERWMNDLNGATPVIANGVLYFARHGEVMAVDPRSGRKLWSDGSIAGIHWQNPIVIEGRLFIADVEGFLTAYALP